MEGTITPDERTLRYSRSISCILSKITNNVYHMNNKETKVKLDIHSTEIGTCSQIISRGKPAGKWHFSTAIEPSIIEQAVP